VPARRRPICDRGALQRGQHAHGVRHLSQKFEAASWAGTRSALAAREPTHRAGSGPDPRGCASTTIRSGRRLQRLARPRGWWRGRSTDRRGGRSGSGCRVGPMTEPLPTPRRRGWPVSTRLLATAIANAESRESLALPAEQQSALTAHRDAGGAQHTALGGVRRPRLRMANAGTATRKFFATIRTARPRLSLCTSHSWEKGLHRR